MLGSQLGVHVFGGLLYVCFNYGVGTLGLAYARQLLYNRATHPGPLVLFLKGGGKSLSTTGVEILVQLLAFQSNNLAIPMSICVFLMVQS